MPSALKILPIDRFFAFAKTHAIVVAKNSKFTWAQTFRDIIVEAIRKGQILALAVAVFLIIFILRVPQQSLPQIWQDLKDAAHEHWIFSVVLNLALTMLWFLHARSLRRQFEAEFERLSQERNQLQERLGIKIKSSNN